MIWKTAAVVSAIATYAYLVITEWVDLFPWNDVSTSTASQKLSGTLVNALPFGLLVLAFVLDLRWFEFLAIGLLIMWLGVHFVWWWAPYFWGASEAHMESYQQFFSRTYRFLPARGNNPIPDAHYVTMQALTLVSLVISLVALVRGQGPRV